MFQFVRTEKSSQFLTEILHASNQKLAQAWQKSQTQACRQEMTLPLQPHLVEQRLQLYKSYFLAAAGMDCDN